MIADLLADLGRANLAAAAAVLTVMMLRRSVRRLFGARTAYALWLLIPAATGASLLPQPASETLVSPIVLTAAEAAGRIAQAPAAPPWLALIWLAGVLATALLLVLRQRSFLASLGRLTPLDRQVLRAERPGVGPAVVGALRPRIVAPADFEARYRPDERQVILAHEAAHLAAGDARINAVAAAAQCVCWFNPLVHLGAHVMRIDQELACDAAVLARFPDARRLYAEVLLKTQLAHQSLPLGCHWPAASEHPLKERIAMLKSPLPAAGRRAAGLALVTLLALGGAGLAWASQPARTPSLITAPDWVQRPNAGDVADVYPPEAAAARQSGGAVITCKVDAQGQLGGCALVKEDPPGQGFGEAALKLTSRFQMKPATKDGKPVGGGVVRIPIRFMVPPAQ